MSTLKTLLDAGAEVVAGTVNLDHEEMGRLRDGDLHLTDEGRAKLAELADSDEKPAKAAAKKAPAKKAAKAEPEASVQDYQVGANTGETMDPADFDLGD